MPWPCWHGRDYHVVFLVCFVITRCVPEAGAHDLIGPVDQIFGSDAEIETENCTALQGSLNLLQRRASLITHENAAASRGTEVPPARWLQMLAYVGHAYMPMAAKARASAFEIESPTTRAKTIRPLLSWQYCLSEEWWPAVLLILTFVALYSGMWWRTVSVERSEAARSVAMVAQGVNALGFTMVVVDAFDVSFMIGGNITYSGAIIGSFMSGAALGGIFAWAVLTVYYEAWRTRQRTLLCIGGVCGILGELGYTIICFYVPMVGDHSADLRTCLLMARALAGVGLGISSFMVRVLFVRLTPQTDRVAKSVRLLFTTVIAMAAGPLVAGIAQFGKSPGAPIAINFQHVGVVAVGLQLISAVCLTLFPDISEEPDRMDMQLEVDNSADLAAFCYHIPSRRSFTSGNGFHKKRVAITCLIILTLRTYAVASVQSASSLILQVQFNWSTTVTGIAVSLTFLVSIPVTLAFFYRWDESAPRSWLLNLMIVAFVGSLFLIPFPASIASPFWILFSDAVVLPTMSLGDGMLVGQMDAHKFPDDILFNVNNRALVTGFLCNGVARLCGPIVTRVLYQYAGQSWYAIQQIFTLFVCVVFFLTIFHRFGEHEETLDTKRSKYSDVSSKKPMLDESKQVSSEALSVRDQPSQGSGKERSRSVDRSRSLERSKEPPPLRSPRQKTAKSPALSSPRSAKRLPDASQTIAV